MKPTHDGTSESTKSREYIRRMPSPTYDRVQAVTVSWKPSGFAEAEMTPC
jgi:hypothetical protein